MWLLFITEFTGHPFSHISPGIDMFTLTLFTLFTLQVREGGAECVAHVEVRAVFGAPDIEAVRHTAVIQLLQGQLGMIFLGKSWKIHLLFLP